MPTADIREEIRETLSALASPPLPEAATALFATLGYSSKRTLRLSSVKQFCDYWDKDGKLTAKERAALDRLYSLHFLFQLTDAEISFQKELGDDPNKLQPTRIHSYLFLAAELPAGDWSRTDLTALARALNKPLPMPALVLFKHGDSLSLAVIHRRLNKVAADRDVLEKATLIRGIRCAAPHRAHLEILADLAFDSLRGAHNVTNFVQLHDAWRETLDIQELNKKFYQQLQHWYFWALGHARFPADAPKDAEDRDALSLIRLLTRLIFVWFLKEKGLVPENLFDERKLATLLKGFAPTSAKAKDSVYYRAILQNLFFATLNCEQSDRAWARDGQNMMSVSLLSDTGFFVSTDAKAAKDRLETYAPVETSSTKLGFLIYREWPDRFSKFMHNKEAMKLYIERSQLPAELLRGGVRGRCYDFADFRDEASASATLDDFVAFARAEGFPFTRVQHPL